MYSVFMFLCGSLYVRDLRGSLHVGNDFVGVQIDNMFGWMCLLGVCTKILCACSVAGLWFFTLLGFSSLILCPRIREFVSFWISWLFSPSGVFLLLFYVLALGNLFCTQWVFFNKCFIQLYFRVILYLAFVSAPADKLTYMIFLILRLQLFWAPRDSVIFYNILHWWLHKW